MTEVAQGFEPGTEVRIKSDPGRVGVVLNKTRYLDETLYQQVRFPDGPQFLRVSDLESTESSDDDPIDLLIEGKFGRARDLRRLLTHIRLSGRLANLIYSMETTNTDSCTNRFKPLLSFLDFLNGDLLIADEVGLGKTIEAHPISTEIRSHVDERRLLSTRPSLLRKPCATTRRLQRACLYAWRETPVSARSRRSIRHGSSAKNWRDDRPRGAL